MREVELECVFRDADFNVLRGVVAAVLDKGVVPCGEEGGEDACVFVSKIVGGGWGRRGVPSEEANWRVSSQLERSFLAFQDFLSVSCLKSMFSSSARKGL